MHLALVHKVRYHSSQMAESKESAQPNLHLSPESQKAFQIAESLALQDNTDIAIQHLTLAVMSRLAQNYRLRLYIAEEVLWKYDITRDLFLTNVIALAKRQADLRKLEPNTKPKLTHHTNNAVFLSVELARREGKTRVEPEHLLIGIAKYSQEQYDKQTSNDTLQDIDEITRENEAAD